MGYVPDAMQQVREGLNRKPADHVLQITFQGLSSFTFPVAHFPTTQVNAQQLYYIFWKCVKMLKTFGFDVLYSSIDGAQSNRSFMEKCVRFGDADNMLGLSPGLPPCIFIMDISHVFKKIRNSLLKSSPNGIRNLTLPSGKHVYWKHFQSAFIWDQSNLVSLHRKLTKDHIFNVMSNSNLKMRNHLAEDVLGQDMLHLMSSYSSAMSDNMPEVEGTIEFLEITSYLCRIFRDSRAVSDVSDVRLMEVEKACRWFSLKIQ
jgi:hypothetical protein